MHGAFASLPVALASTGLTFVVFGTVAFSIIMSVLFLVTRGSDSMYDQIGQGGISREGDGGGPVGMESAAGRAEREHEIRQMLTARSERRVRRGEPALDVEAELARLLAQTAPHRHDPALEAEVRQLVLARNERRERQGLDPLEVEAEVQRTLRELDP